MKQIKHSDRRKKHSKSHFDRKEAYREPRPRVLIVTEGSVTEINYFERVVQHLRLTSVEVDINGDSGSAPISVVEHAYSLYCREGASKGGGYSIVYCVIDRDSHDSFDAALAEVERINEGVEDSFIAIPSFPCFETWFLMHYSNFRTPITASAGRSSGDNTVRALQENLEFNNYDKKLTPAQLGFLIDRMEVAATNSSRALADAIEINELNPSTRVHEIITKLLELKAEQQN